MIGAIEIMKTVCNQNICTGCLACINVCPKAAISINDSLDAYNAVIDQNKCINCSLCEKVCPVINIRDLKSPIYWKQGWAEDEIRKNSSSGGAASAIIRTFIYMGGYVASCLFKNGEFRFTVTNDIDEAKKFAGSKYVKSNPASIYKEIKKLLTEGQKVLFIGLPCQSAAVQNVCGEQEKLYTADLICHGTPSPKILKQFIDECGLKWSDISDIKFRESDSFGLESNGIRLAPSQIHDSYTRAFLRGLDYTENCYSCRYATLNRVSDITLGDAWGQLSDTQKDGVSLILCQTQKGIELVEKAGLHIEEVDLEKAVNANNQLKHPSKMHPGRSKFFKGLGKGYTVNRTVAFVFPKESIKQSIKMYLIKMHIIKDPHQTGGVSNNYLF